MTSYRRPTHHGTVKGSTSSALIVVASAFFLAAPALFCAARAAAEPYPEIAVDQVAVRIDGQDHAFGHRDYPKPVVLDLKQATGARHTPYHTLLSYLRVLANIADFAEIAPYVRLSNGDPGKWPDDARAHNQAARDILSGNIIVSGEIVYGDYRIYITRFAKSIPRNSGVAIRRFGGAEHYVVQDLINSSPLIHRLSALRWDVARLEAEHPIPE